LAACFFLLGASNTVLTFAAALFFAAGNGLMWPSYLSLLSKRGGAEVQGAVQGIASSAGSLASIVGLVLGGVLYELLGPTTFFVSGGVIVLVFLLSIRIRSQRPASRPTDQPEARATDRPAEEPAGRAADRAAVAG
jgi:DHA1 family tetracycline resistance protein-like MFS transporter